MAPVLRGPPKRKTRTWDPKPAVSIDSLPPEKQNIANQNRPKRAKRAEQGSPGFVLDYNRNRESQRQYRGKGKLFHDAAEIERRQPRSQSRMPPLSLMGAEEQVSRKSKEKLPRELLGPSGGSGGSDGHGGPGGPGGSGGSGGSGGPGGPGGSGNGVGRATKAVSMAPVTSAAVSSIGTSGVSMTRLSGSSPHSPEPPLPNIDWRIELAKGNEMWANALASTKLHDRDLEVEDVIPIFEKFCSDSWRKTFRTDYLENPEYDGKRTGATGHVRWYVSTMRQREKNEFPLKAFAPMSPKELRAIKERRGTRAWIDDFIHRARLNYERLSAADNLSTKRSSTKSDTMTSTSGPSTKLSSRPIAPVTSSVPLPTLPATTYPSSKTIGSRPVPKSAARPGFKQKIEAGPFDAKVAELLPEYRYLTEDITFNRDPANYFTLEGLEEYLREALERGQSIKLVKKSDFKGYSNEEEAPSQYQISDDALKAVVKMFKHYTEESMGFNSIEGLEQYIRMRYERGESIDLQTKKNHEGKTEPPISDADLEALLSQYSFLVDPFHIIFYSRQALEMFIRHYYDTDKLFGSHLARRPAVIPPVPPLAPSSTGASILGEIKTTSELPTRSLAVEAVDRQVDELMRKWGHLCIGNFALWSEQDLREYLRERVERNEPIAIPLMSTIKRPSTELPSTKLPLPSTTSAPAGSQEQITKAINPFSAMAESPEFLRVTTPTTVPSLTTIDTPTSIDTIVQQPTEDSIKVVKRPKKVAKASGHSPLKEFSPVPSWTSINIPKKTTKTIGQQPTKKSKRSTKKSVQEPIKDSTPAGGSKDVINPKIRSSIIYRVESLFGLEHTGPPPLTFKPNIGFHYISDLHLEQTSYDNFDFTPTVSYLILAGDIGYAHPEKNHEERYREFLARMCAKPVLKRIFLVAGNRDFWPQKRNTMTGALEILRGFAAHPSMLGKLTFMENDRFEIEEGGGKIVILGATLWTENRNPGGSEPSDQNNAQRTARHKESCEFIRRETEKIRKDPGEAETRILIITHMPPSKSGTSNPRYTAMRVRDFKSGMNHGSDVIDGVKGYTYDHSEIGTTMPLLDHRDVWIWGHTHWNEPLVGKIRHGGMRFECNQRGNAKGPAKKYDPQPKGSFQPEKVIYV
ncbi:hypothetical protein MFRU_007g03290 [Monilinia fructicola]|nr:hypothetical protein MFRU_007g03290 [Monilinia fructicola]